MLPIAWPGGRVEVSMGIFTDRAGRRLVHAHAAQRGRARADSGDFDGQIPTAGTEAWTRSLGIPAREPWRTSRTAVAGGGSGPSAGSVVSFNSTAGGFTLLTIRGAGHMAPRYTPLESFAMIERFLDGSPY